MKYLVNWEIQGFGPKTLLAGDVVDLTAEQAASFGGSACVSKYVEPKKESAAEKAAREKAEKEAEQAEAQRQAAEALAAQRADEAAGT